MNNISLIPYDKCYSCRSCEQICPKNCIDMIETPEGFIYPHINTCNCIDCGLCLNHCPSNFLPTISQKQQEFYALKLKDKEKILQSASGGVFAGIAEYILSLQGIVFGASFTDNFNVVHTKVTSLSELEKLKGSKYVESDTKQTYSEVKQFLSEKKIVLYSGTPCQIAGLKNFLKIDYDNLFTLDLICHGVPSRKLFQKYINWLSTKFNENIIYYNFRDKEVGGWSCDGKVKTTTTTKIITGYKDPYYSSFLNSSTYKMSCYSCKYANIKYRTGDITIGDFWGVSFFYPKFYSNKGVSEIVINTEKGLKLFNSVKTSFDVLPITLEQAAYHNGNLVKNTNEPECRKTIYSKIDNTPLNEFMKSLLPSPKIILMQTIKSLIPQSIKNIIKSQLGGKIK